MPMDISRKKIILIVIGVTAGSLLFLAVGIYLYFIMQFNVYHDEQYKFSIKYPKTWKVVVHPKESVAVVFLRPKDTELDALQENFNVTVQAVPEDIINLAQFTARIKTQMTAVFEKSINIVEDKPYHWGWRDGHIWAIEAPRPDHLKMVNAWLINDNNQAYILTFLGDMNKYAQDRFYVFEMIHSLQLQ